MALENELDIINREFGNIYRANSMGLIDKNSVEEKALTN